MKETLIIAIHPNLENSIVNKRWNQELKKYPEKFVLHDLYAEYPNEKIDVEKEQRLIEAYDKIVFQFPLYWFNCPPLFKKWLDEVLAHGWAYGKNSEYKLKDKKIALSISIGIKEEDYKPSGRYKYTLEQLTAPFEITFNYIKADYRPLFASYGFEHDSTEATVEKSTQEYITFLNNL